MKLKFKAFSAHFFSFIKEIGLFTVQLILRDCYRHEKDCIKHCKRSFLPFDQVNGMSSSQMYTFRYKNLPPDIF